MALPINHLILNHVIYEVESFRQHLFSIWQTQDESTRTILSLNKLATLQNDKEKETLRPETQPKQVHECKCC